MAKLNLEFLYWELNRVSEWIRFSDRKSAFLSVYYTWLFWFLLSQKQLIFENIPKNGDCYILIIILIWISFILGFILLFASIFPSLKNWKKDNSLFYFKHISKMDITKYTKEIWWLSEKDARKQIIEQIYTNSNIANSKMENVQRSTKVLFILIILISILLFLN